MLVVFRLSLRNGLRGIRRRGFNLRHILAIGEGSALETLISRVDKFPELGLKVLGVVTHESSASKTVANKPVLGHFNEVGKIVHDTRVDKVLIALSRQHYAELDRILKELKEETVDIQLIPDVHEYNTLGCEVEEFDGLPIVRLNDSPLNGWGALAKRATDAFVSAIALLILSPILLFIAFLVRITSKGPIFYGQERMGLDGRTFQMLKFRSMRVDAEDSTGAVWAKAGDDRRTPIGAFIRATSLDELPQLLEYFQRRYVACRPETRAPRVCETVPRRNSTLHAQT